MSVLTIISKCAALLVAGVISITLRVLLQAPAVIIFGVVAVVVAISALKSGRQRHGESTGIKTRCPWLLGLPVVSTSWRGIPQLVDDSDAAILCDINAPEQYADVIEQVLKHADKRQQMGEAARRHYENYYTRDKFVAAMAEVFEEAGKG
jgi:glycosyltransferase involved in cell wall biosynthesis